MSFVKMIPAYKYTQVYKLGIIAHIDSPCVGFCIEERRLSIGKVLEKIVDDYSYKTYLYPTKFICTEIISISNAVSRFFGYEYAGNGDRDKRGYIQEYWFYHEAIDIYSIV